MKKGWLEIYALAVCFFAIACFVIVLGIGIWDIVKVAAPDFTMHSANWEKHQTDEAFKEALIQASRYDPDKETYVPPEGAALTKAREESYARTIRSERRDGFQGIVRNLIILVIDIVVFLVHWMAAARARQTAS